MSPTTAVTTAKTDRFGRAYQSGARIVYPTRRGSFMELVEATVIGTSTIRDWTRGTINVLYVRRNNGKEVTLRNLWDVVVIP